MKPVSDAVLGTPRVVTHLDGGGEMGRLMREHDWSHSTLGEPGQWPHSLRITVALLLNTGHPMYIYWGADGACLYNDAYRQLIGPERHPGSLGRPAVEVWAEIWPTIGPEFEQVMSGGAATWHVDELIPITRNGRREDVYWTYSYSPIADEQAPTGVGGVLVICTETTGHVLARARLKQQADSYKRVFEQAPGFICILKGPEHRFDFVNDAYVKLVGERDFAGRTVLEVIPESEAQGFIARLDHTYATGERHVASHVPIRLDRGAHVTEERYLDFIYAPVVDRHGQISGIFVEGYDVTEAHLAQQVQERQAHRLQLLVDELNHRVKNTLAIVQVLAFQTFRGDAQMSDAAARFAARLSALAAAHDVLTAEHWEDADLAGIFRASLGVHAVGDDRCRMSGPAVRVSPHAAVTLAMVLHELATNAGKYGSWSNAHGSVDLSWLMDGQQLRVRWRELDGPVVLPPGAQGLGTKMITRALSGEPGGRVSLDFAPAGLECELTLLLPGHGETPPPIGAVRTDD